LIATKCTQEEIAKKLGLDSIYYLSKEGLVEATGLAKDHFCLACFDGDYPVAPDLSFKKEALDR
jgi:amidophosphoribosyltransferase